MKNQALKLISLTGLALTIVPSILVLYQQLSWENHALLMLVGMVLWFSTAPFWMSGEVQ